MLKICAYVIQSSPYSTLEKLLLSGPMFYLCFLLDRPVMFYNPLGQARDEVVSLYTDSPSVEVKDSIDVTVMSQIDPVWTGKGEVSSTKFKVCSCVSYGDPEGGQNCDFSTIKYYVQFMPFSKSFKFELTTC